MEFDFNFLVFSLAYAICICCFCSPVLAEQSYIGKSAPTCYGFGDDTSPTVNGYNCSDGVYWTCGAYLTFRSQPLYNTPYLISQLLNANPAQIAAANAVLDTSILEDDKIVFIPIICSCQNSRYYLKVTPYMIQQGDCYENIANTIFQGLTTCQALKYQNPLIDYNNLPPGYSISVPLRCACPSKEQTDASVKYLITYAIHSGDSINSISRTLGVDPKTVREANNLSEGATIYPETTLLVPLQIPQTPTPTPPMPMSMSTPPPTPPTPPPPPPPPPPPASPSPSPSPMPTGKIVGIAIAAVTAVAALLGFGYTVKMKNCCNVNNITSGKSRT